MHGPNERTDQNSRKRAKRKGDKQSVRCRFQNTVYTVLLMFKELSEHLSSIKKTQPKTKGTITEIKNNF